MTKRVDVRILGAGIICKIDVSPDMTVGDALAAVHRELDWVMVLVRGEAASDETEKIYERVKDGEIVFVMPRPEPGG